MMMMMMMMTTTMMTIQKLMIVTSCLCQLLDLKTNGMRMGEGTEDGNGTALDQPGNCDLPQENV